MTFKIRAASKADTDALCNLSHQAFGAEEDGLIAAFARDLLVTDSTPPTFVLIAEAEQTAIGFVGFSPVFMADSDKPQAYILAPLGVLPGYQKQGVGTALIEYGIERLKSTAVDVLLVYGDPGYYGRFGFDATTGRNFRPPFELEYSFGWQAMLLNGGHAGDTAKEFTCVDALNKPELW